MEILRSYHRRHLQFVNFNVILMYIFILNMHCVSGREQNLQGANSVHCKFHSQHLWDVASSLYDKNGYIPGTKVRIKA